MAASVDRRAVPRDLNQNNGRDFAAGRRTLRTPAAAAARLNRGEGGRTNHFRFPGPRLRVAISVSQILDCGFRRRGGERKASSAAR